LGKEVGKIETLRLVYIEWGYPETDNDVQSSPESALCLQDFLCGIENNTSIETLRVIHLCSGHGALVFDLGHLVRNLFHLKELIVQSHEPSPQQLLMLTRALENNAMKSFNMSGCIFDTHEFERVILACSNVRELVVRCPEDDVRAQALSSLLRSPAAALTHLNVEISDLNNDHVSFIAKRLMSGNKNVTTLIMCDQNFEGCISDLEDEEDISVKSLDLNPFSSLLCDASSIRSIYSSDHTLVNIYTCVSGYFIGDHYDQCVNNFPQYVTDLLELNKNKNKDQVIRQKILRYYFAKSKFDLSEFIAMPLPLLTKVMALLAKRDSNQALFWLVRNIPNLCHLSDRVTRKRRLQSDTKSLVSSVRGETEPLGHIERG